MARDGRAAANASSTQYLPELDGLRAVAILLVIAYHAWDYRGPNPLGRALTAVAVQGWVGVDVFFAMSGFLITRILIATRNSPRYYSSFYIRRSLRIFPLYYGVLLALVAAVFIAAAFGIELGDVTVAHAKRSWVNFLYLSNFAVAFWGSNVILLDISWSLAVEEQFYLVYPWVVRRFTPRKLELVLVATIALAIPLRWLSFRYVPGSLHGPYALPYCRMDALAFGCLAALVLQRADQRAARMVAAVALPLWLVAVATVGVFNRGQLFLAVFGYGLVAAATAATIVRLQLGGWSWLACQLRRPSLVAVGKLSYGIYLLHLFVRAGANYLPWIGSASPYRELLVVVAGRALLIGGVGYLAAWCSWTLFESKFMQLKDRLGPTPAAAER